MARRRTTPIQVAQYGLQFHGNFRRTGDTTYLALSVRHAEKLLSVAHVIDGALFFPYQFDHTHASASDDPASFQAPWYSGMAQGEALSLFVRLHQTTEEPRYMEAAHDVLASFSRLRGYHAPFIAGIDAEGYYWIEEYPWAKKEDQTLNGFMFAIYGLYEYWALTRTDDARHLLNASLSSLRRYIDDYRVPGGISYYCLAHRTRRVDWWSRPRQNAKYHNIHIQQLQNMALISGDDYFGAVAEAFEADAL